MMKYCTYISTTSVMVTGPACWRKTGLNNDLWMDHNLV